jgi:hypothetical protein
MRQCAGVGRQAGELPEHARRLVCEQAKDLAREAGVVQCAPAQMLQIDRAMVCEWQR